MNHVPDEEQLYVNIMHRITLPEMSAGESVRLRNQIRRGLQDAYGGGRAQVQYTIREALDIPHRMGLI